jgi:hypothetical protein
VRVGRVSRHNAVPLDACQAWESSNVGDGNQARLVCGVGTTELRLPAA